MSGVHIITDSSCDLTAQEAADSGVTVVPLSIRFGPDEYVDRVELSLSDFYSKMATSAVLPETAAPSPGAFEQAFRDAIAAGANGIVCVNISSGLSATIQSARTAAKSVMEEVDIQIVDSRSITGGLGSQVLEAARAASEGSSTDEIVTMLSDMSERTMVYGALDTLDNLKKGGRIGNAQALLGSMLSIKPVIQIKGGLVEEAAKPRTRRKAFDWLRQRLFEEPSVTHLSVMHGMAPDIDDFLEMIEPRFPRGSYRLVEIGAVIGSHGGPRVVGVCYVRG